MSPTMAGGLFSATKFDRLGSIRHEGSANLSRRHLAPLRSVCLLSLRFKTDAVPLDRDSGMTIVDLSSQLN